MPACRVVCPGGGGKRYVCAPRWMSVRHNIRSSHCWQMRCPVDPVDAEQVESVVDAGQVGDDLFSAGHAYGANDRGLPGAREVDGGQTGRARGEERIDDVDFC